MFGIRKDDKSVKCFILDIAVKGENSGLQNWIEGDKYYRIKTILMENQIKSKMWNSWMIGYDQIN